jgi:FtsH-binding integral membrane protein
MNNLTKYPTLIFVLSLLLMWLSARIGSGFRKKQPNLEEGVRQDLDVIVAATLTLLALIIGFTFSMAINRYDQRKIYEESEANAIGTEYVRADLLPAANAAKVRTLLKDYLDQRISFYQTRDEIELRQVEDRTAQLEAELWSAVRAPAMAQPTPVMGLAVSGMNDVLNSRGYTQAAWWNRIPIAAWALMAAIAICANVLVGYSARRAEAGGIQFLVLPLILSIAFFLIADNDSPRRGIIRVDPQNLISLAQFLRSH